MSRSTIFWWYHVTMLNACAEAHALAPLRFARAVEMWYFGSLASRSPIRQAGTRTGTTSSSDILQLVFTETELLAECQVLALHWCASSHQPGTKLITSFQPGIESRGLACQSTLKWSNNTINWTLFSCLHEMKKYAVIYGAGEAEGVEVIICRFWTVIDIWFVNKNMTGSVQVLHKHFQLV